MYLSYIYLPAATWKNICQLIGVEANRLCDLYKDLDSITKMFQKSNLIIAEARTLFDGVIENFSETESKLSGTAHVVHLTSFESSLIKLQQNRCDKVTEEEVEAAKSLLSLCNNSIDSAQSQDGGQLLFAESIMKKRKIDSSRSTYVDIHFILPTTNIAGQFFSKPGYSIIKQHTSINPCIFEVHRFLHIDSEM